MHRFLAGCLIGNAHMRSLMAALLESQNGQAVMVEEDAEPPRHVDIYVVALNPYQPQWLKPLSRLRAVSAAPALAIAPPISRRASAELQAHAPLEVLTTPFDLATFQAALDAARLMSAAARRDRDD